VDSVEAPGYRHYLSSNGAGSYRLIIAGPLGSGRIAQLHIPDQRRAADYAAVVEQVAARGTYRQQDPAGYRLSLAP
jgi:hypothetical protein